ncbi:tyrosine-protein phosphatase non-receptor type 18 isoform X2 [Betta splendens]|uniref:protein-tyrosine-phosphatase n=1 Tax=Betta splendens TaxID=158456 RepID=A0A9W2XX81_BETSP|nr:tyrosine-protein phosphatase non-receptor type 18 isoform X2 [Betta splendens]
MSFHSDATSAAGRKDGTNRALTPRLLMVRSQTLALKKDLGLTTEAGALKENIRKNRYRDILPYDQSRVLLSLPTTDTDADYINASLVKGASAGNGYIASQGPLSSTVIDFWRMIWQYDVKVIVMACREMELGKRKCECYWAPLDQSTAFGPFTVQNQEETQPNDHVVVRRLTVTFQQTSRTVIQYQFLSWPDHDVPYEATGVVDLLDRARTSQGEHTSPMLIHCSAGCGRTGVICALDYIHSLLVTKITSDFSIMSIVLGLRRQRPSAVQTKDQYRFIFTAAACMLERALQRAEPQLYCNVSELKKQEKKKNNKFASSTQRSSEQTDMNDTYAVVNKPKHPQPPADSAHSVALPRQSRSLPSTHHYDNDCVGPPAAPIYSTVKPRTGRHDTAALSDRSSVPDHTDYELLSAEHRLSTDDDYEDVSNSSTGIGFNCRIQKPRGPRDPPAEWSRLER